LKHYSHIRMQAKRRAVNALVVNVAADVPAEVIPVEPAKVSAKVERTN